MTAKARNRAVPVTAILLSLLACGFLAGCGGRTLGWQPPAPAMPKAKTTGVPVSPAPQRGLLPGVYEQGLPDNWRLVSEFTAQTSVTPKIILYYSGWNEKFRADAAGRAHSLGAYLLVQMQPNTVSLRSIADGRSDQYLYSYAEAVRNYGYPVILSFGHEMNGTWYSWGSGRSSPADFVAAWRHIVKVFRTVGATNVTWLWTVNSTNVASADLQPWWPGSAWVNWVGLDGYYFQSSATFSSVFGQTLADIRRFSNAPALISETAVGPTSDRNAQIQGLFQGAYANHIVGVVWFDQTQNDGATHQDWRLEDAPDALAQYKDDARKYATGTTMP